MRVFVTRKLPLWAEVSQPLMETGWEVVMHPNKRGMTREEIKAEIAKGYDGLICLLTDKIDEDLLGHDKSGQLKMIANYAVGYDNIDVGACAKRNIKVSNTPCDEVNESVAEFTWALILALARRIGEASEFMHNAAYKGWEPDIFLGSDVRGKTLGLVGMGRIGKMVARGAGGFGARVMYYNRKPAEGVEYEYKFNIEDLIGQSDIVSLHVPLTPETKHLINGKSLVKFRKGALLVNTSRGQVVDETEVAEALRAGFLGGYAADVFENEPDPHPELIQMENVVLTPHIASATWEARRAIGKLVMANLIAGLKGETPPNLVTT